MYTFLMGVQHIGILVVIIELLYAYQKKPSKIQTMLITILIATLVNLVGYSFEMQAGDRERAIMAVKVIYLGKPYIILGTFLFVMEYCGIRIKRWIVCTLCVIHIGVSALVFTCTKHTLFYSSISYTEEGLFPHLVLGHGIIYILYTALIMIYMLLMLTVCVTQYRKTSISEEKKRILCMGVIVGVSVLGLAVFLSGITGGYDSTVPAYVIADSILLLSIVKYNLMEPLVVAKDMIIDEIRDGLFVFDSGGTLIYANAQAQVIYPKMDNGAMEKILEEITDLYQTQEKLCMENNIYEIHEKDIIRKNVVYGKIYIIRDVTESYKYTINLKKQKAIAEQANKAKSDFLARMSHEIRTPINSVLGMNEMILRESDNQEIKKYAMNVKTSANSLLSIINDILDMSKIESKKLEIQPVEYELDSLLNDLVNMIYVKAKEKDLEFKVVVDKSIPNKLYGDDVRIRQILLNLLTNAVKYTPKGSVALAVSGTAEKENVRLHFKVSDTGIGIKEEDMPKLFATFERIEDERNRNIEGTGLGMNIVQNLLKMMDSRLNVSSVYGEGSEFCFELEQRIISYEEIGDFQERVKQLYQEYQYHVMFTAPEAKILLVDDNDINRSVFRNLVKQTKVQITDADSGKKCLELVEREHFDLIFMDHMMPGMDGIETLHRLQKMESSMCKGVPVIILTANAVTGAKEQYLSEGFEDFLFKPIVPEKLEQMIMEYLPKELVKEKVVEDESDMADKQGIEELPDIEEFDWEYAKAHLPDTGILKQTIQHFYYSMNQDIAELEELSKRLNDDEALGLYRTKVHSLKSTTAIIGALLLSKLARLLEVAAIEKDYKKIHMLNPIMIEEMQKHKIRMKVFVESAGDKKDISDTGRIKEQLDTLKDALEERDYDVADEIMEQLKQYRYDTAVQQMIDNLEIQIMNLEAKKGMETINHIIREFNGGYDEK